MVNTKQFLFLAALTIIGNFYGSISVQAQSKTNDSISNCQKNSLLAVLREGADSKDFCRALKLHHAKLTETISVGKTKILLLSTEAGKLAETENMLKQNSMVKCLQRNYLLETSSYAQVPGDPQNSFEWHLGAIHATDAWRISRGRGSKIGILDTGVHKIPDLVDRMRTFPGGYDDSRMRGPRSNSPYPVRPQQLSNTATLAALIDQALHDRNASIDALDHGTAVASTAAATNGNGIGTAGVAPEASIYSIKVCPLEGTISDESLIRGLEACQRRGIKIAVVSCNSRAPHSLSNRQDHPAFHAAARDFHDRYGGLIFLSAGNDAEYDLSERAPYLIVVSSMNRNLRSSDFSTFGRPLWFAAPGEQIYCSNSSGHLTIRQGTSFSAPIVAATAALVWSANPNLRNTDVEQILKQSCYKPANPNSEWNPWYGFGMPDAGRAVALSSARRR